MFTTRKKINPQNSQLIELLNKSVNNFEKIGKADHADSKGTYLGAGGNPNFVAQFDITLLLKFFTVAAGVYTKITPAALLVAQTTLANQLPAFVFGNSEYAGGFARLRALFPLVTWAYDQPFVYGQGYQGTIFGVLDATIKAELQAGDLVIPVYAVLGGVNYLGVSIVRCKQVGYGTLLDALNSDQFDTTLVRYILNDTSATGLLQYDQNIKTFRQSLFGKSEDDFVSPNSYKLPEQQQAGIVDIPLKKTIDKEASLATYINYNITSVQWSIFVNKVNKVN